MKKFSMIALIVAMVFCLSFSVFAADITAPGTANTTLTYTVGSSYTVTIPESVTCSSGNFTGSLDIAVAAGSLIDNQRIINVTIGSSDYSSDGNKWFLKKGDASIEYTIKDGTTYIQGNDVVLEASTAEAYAGKDVTLTLAAAGSPSATGNYTDVLTFTISVDNAND